MLGSLSEADDAVQEAWLRLSRSDTGEVDNLGGWLTTVVGAGLPRHAAVARRSRREEPLGAEPLDPARPRTAADPEQEALLADSVGLALLVVLETLDAGGAAGVRAARHVRGARSTRSRSIVDRTPAAARQLASRARRRVQGALAAVRPRPALQRTVVERVPRRRARTATSTRWSRCSTPT